MSDRLRDLIIETCAQIADDEPEPGEPTPEQRIKIEAAGAVAIGAAAIKAAKASIARRIRALKTVS